MNPDTLVVAVSDSAAVFNWFTDTLPGINPAFVMLIAGYLATRAIWLVKFVVKHANLFRPLLDKIQKVWETQGWVINPILMVLAGFLTTGKWDTAAIMAAAGIGIKEWLTRSPIPTTKEELKRMKGALAITAVFGLLFLGNSNSYAQEGINPPALKEYEKWAFSLGGGMESDPSESLSGLQDKQWDPVASAKISRILSGHLSLQAQLDRAIAKNPHYRPSVRLWLNF